MPLAVVFRRHGSWIAVTREVLLREEMIKAPDCYVCEQDLVFWGKRRIQVGKTCVTVRPVPRHQSAAAAASSNSHPTLPLLFCNEIGHRGQTRESARGKTRVAAPTILLRVS